MDVYVGLQDLMFLVGALKKLMAFFNHMDLGLSFFKDEPIAGSFIYGLIFIIIGFFILQKINYFYLFLALSSYYQLLLQASDLTPSK